MIDVRRSQRLGISDETSWQRCFPPTFSRQTYSVDLVSDDQEYTRESLVLFCTATGERLMLLTTAACLEMVFQNITNTLMSSWPIWSSGRSHWGRVLT